MADANTDENFALGTSDCRAESLEREFGERVWRAEGTASSQYDFPLDLYFFTRNIRGQN